MRGPADYAADELTHVVLEGEARPLGRMVGNVLASYAARFSRAAPAAAVAWRAIGRLDRKPHAGDPINKQESKGVTLSDCFEPALRYAFESAVSTRHDSQSSSGPKSVMARAPSEPSSLMARS